MLRVLRTRRSTTRPRIARDAFKHVVQAGLRIDADELGRAVQGVRHCRAVPAIVGTEIKEPAARLKVAQQRWQNLLMNAKQELPDEALSAMAIEWRRKALEGDFRARGIAHELETELRRRAGAPFAN